MSKILSFFAGKKHMPPKPSRECDPDTTAREILKTLDEQTIYAGYLYYSYFIAPSLVRPLRHPADGPLVSKYLWDRVSPSMQLDFVRRSQVPHHIHFPPTTMFMSDDLVRQAYDHLSRDYHAQEIVLKPGFNFRHSYDKPVIPQFVYEASGWPDEETEPVPIFWEPTAVPLISGPPDAVEPEVPQEPLLPLLDELEGLEDIKSLPAPPPVHLGALLCPSWSRVPADVYEKWETRTIERLRDSWPNPYYLGLTGPDPQADEKRRAAALANIQDPLAYRNDFDDIDFTYSSPSNDGGSIYSSPSNYPESDDGSNQLYQGGAALFRMRPAVPSEAASSAWEERVDLRGFVARGENGFDFESSPESGGTADSGGSYAPDTDAVSFLELEPGPELSPSPEPEMYVRIARGRSRSTSLSFVCGSALLDVSPPDLRSLSSVAPSPAACLSPEWPNPYSPNLTDDEEDLYWAEADMDHPPARPSSV